MNLYKHSNHGHLKIAEVAPEGYVLVSLTGLGTSPATVEPIYRNLETTSPGVWHPHLYYDGVAEQENPTNGFSNAIIYAYKRSNTQLTDTPGAITYNFSTASITSTLSNGWSKAIGDTVGSDTLYVSIIHASSQSVTASYLSTDWQIPTILYQATQDVVTILLSNQSHAIPTDNAGNGGNYTGSGTDVRVYEGTTELAYDGVGASNGTWTASLMGTYITPGSKVDAGNYLTISEHSNMGADIASVSITVSGKRINGASFTLPATIQSLTKSKAGANGIGGGPTVSITSSRPTSFTATDTKLDSNQSNIILTATVNNLVSPTISWTFQGFQINPIDSGTTVQTITAEQFGVTSSAKVTVTVNSLYVDTVTIVRLEKSTAQPGATRNVFMGDWEININYLVGDIVVDSSGYGWTCITNHTSNSIDTTPVYPITSNSLWTLYTVKGERGQGSLEAYSFLRSYTLPATPTGGNYNNPIAIGWYDGIPVGNDPVYMSKRTFTSDSLPPQDSTWSTPTLFAKDGETYITTIESTNGTAFKVNQDSTTTLIARIFKNGVEVTNFFHPNQFSWRRVSMINPPVPNDDASWNTLYSSGYKQIVVSVDDVDSNATFFCDIINL